MQIKFQKNHSNIKVEELQSNTNFIKWKRNFQNSGCKLKIINIKAIVRNNDKTIITIYLEVNFNTPEGKNITRNILIRGKAVVIIPYVYINQKPFFLVVKQRRIIDGRFSLEFPAGGVSNSKNSSFDAVKELYEETGILCHYKELLKIGSNINACESCFDEKVDWFLLELNNEKIKDSLKTKKFGINENGEFTEVKIISYKQLKKINSMQIQTGIALMGNYNVFK